MLPNLQIGFPFSKSNTNGLENLFGLELFLAWLSSIVHTQSSLNNF